MNKILRLVLIPFFLIALLQSNLQANSSPTNDSLKVEVEVINPSSTINNGEIRLKVTGGKEPYQYKWSNQNTALTASRASGLIEGKEYTVRISDANNQVVDKKLPLRPNPLLKILTLFLIQWLKSWEMSCFGIHLLQLDCMIQS